MNAVFVQATFYHLLAHLFQCRIAFRLSLESFFPPMYECFKSKAWGQKEMQMERGSAWGRLLKKLAKLDFSLENGLTKHPETGVYVRAPTYHFAVKLEILKRLHTFFFWLAPLSLRTLLSCEGR